MELMIEKMLGFTMILTRISAFFIFLPVFGSQSIPTAIKAAVTVLIAIFFSIIIPSNIDAANISALKAGLLIVNEAIYGLAMGLTVVIVFSAVKLGGNMIEREMGFTMSEILDPMTGDVAEPLSIFLEMIFIILFLTANGHHLFLLTISGSYRLFPAGAIPTIPVLTDGIVKAGLVMFVAGLRLAAPMLAAFLLLIVVLAVLARIVPEMDILFISFPLRIGLGLIMIAIFLPFINGYVNEFAEWMGKLLPI